jgi:hypothetical protein
MFNQLNATFMCYYAVLLGKDGCNQRARCLRIVENFSVNADLPVRTPITQMDERGNFFLDMSAISARNIGSVPEGAGAPAFFPNHAHDTKNSS